MPVSGLIDSSFCVPKLTADTETATPEADSLNAQKFRHSLCLNFLNKHFCTLNIFSIKEKFDSQVLGMMILTSIKSYLDLLSYGGGIQFLKPQS